jgi:hypothetical protein
MILNFRGLHASTNSGIGAYQEIVGWTYPVGGGEGSPIYGGMMSQASCSAILSGVLFTDSDGGYDEYSNSGKGGQVEGLVGDFITNFSAWVGFRVQFESQTAAAVYGGMSPIQVSVVPEPATMLLLGFGGMALSRLRKSR